VFVASLLAGSLLGRWWTVLVPLSALAVLQPLEWGMTYRGYMVGAMAGITFFVVSGYVFVGVLGRRLRPRVLFRVKSVALLTTISVVPRFAPASGGFLRGAFRAAFPFPDPHGRFLQAGLARLELPLKGLQPGASSLDRLVLPLQVRGHCSHLPRLLLDGLPFLRHVPGHEGLDRRLLLRDAFSLRLQFLHHRLRLGPLPLEGIGQLFESFLAPLHGLCPRLQFGLGGLKPMFAGLELLAGLGDLLHLL